MKQIVHFLSPKTEALPQSMRALQLQEYSVKNPSLKVIETELPRMEHNDVLVKIARASINPSDLFFLRGQYGVKKELPVVPGFEGCGVIVAAGNPLLARALVGKRVACGAKDTGSSGTWAEFLSTHFSRVIPLRESIGDEQGAMLLANPYTAWAFAHIAESDGHKAMVQTAAASAVGRMLIKHALRKRIPLINIVRQPEQVDALRSIGAEHVLLSTDENFKANLKQLVRTLKATVCFDSVAGPLTGEILQAMPSRAVLYLYGGMSEQPCSINPAALIFGSRRVEGFWAAKYFRTPKRAHLFVRAAFEIQAHAGDFESQVQGQFGLDEISNALGVYTKNMSQGKVILDPTRHAADSFRA